jgi:hypothetical protein
VFSGVGVIGVLGGLVNLVVPLSLGGSGSAASAAAALLVTVENAPGWTTGVAQVTGVILSPGSTATGTLTLSGSDSRTPGLRGRMSLVAASRVVTNNVGNSALFATLSLRFAPEPIGVLALAAALSLSLLGLAHRRR